MYNWLPMITSLYSAYLLLSWFSTLRASLLLLAVITEMTQQWLHRKRYSRFSFFFSSNLGGCPNCTLSWNRSRKNAYIYQGLNELPLQVYKVSLGASVTQRAWIARMGWSPPTSSCSAACRCTVVVHFPLPEPAEFSRLVWIGWSSYWRNHRAI